MREILVAVFDTAANADRAVQALEHANVSSASIRRYHRDDPALENLSTGTSTYADATSTAAVDADRSHQRSSGFWAWLTGEDGGTSDPTYESDHVYYGRHIESGSTVLAVTSGATGEPARVGFAGPSRLLKLEDVGTEAGARQVHKVRPL